MKVEVKMDSVGAILRRRGLETGGRVQRMFTAECARQMDPYVPMRQGTLKNVKRTIGLDYVKYDGPYAHYQYMGILYVDPITKKGCFYDPSTGKMWSRPGVKKIPSERKLTYHGSPKRGPKWDKRMWSDKGNQITAKIAAAAGGRAK